MTTNPTPVADLFDLSGRVAVVTGGSRGIGKAIVEGFAQAGADVVIASRKYENCAALADEITQRTGRRALPVKCHVGIWAECDSLVQTVYEQLGRCDILVNNAGMSPIYPDLVSITEEYYDKVAAVNLKGPFRLGALFGARMAAESGGSIINISTIGSLRPSPTELVYSCAKAGLNALTIGLASTYAPSVRCNAILPGEVLTDIAEAWTAEQRANAAERAPLGRAGLAEDLVGTALWLASDASAWVTGTLTRVDGGQFRQNT
jgi:NAD(P)-dependent dehydrogenase (short-subunit alcohol dehydrogenase family)